VTPSIKVEILRRMAYRGKTKNNRHLVSNPFLGVDATGGYEVVECNVLVMNQFPVLLGQVQPDPGPWGQETSRSESFEKASL